MRVQRMVALQDGTKTELNHIQKELNKKYGARFSHDSIIKKGLDLLKKKEKLVLNKPRGGRKNE